MHAIVKKIDGVPSLDVDQFEDIPAFEGDAASSIVEQFDDVPNFEGDAATAIVEPC